MKRKVFIPLILLASLIPFENDAQQQQSSSSTVKPMDAKLFKNFKFRSIGPAFMSGRIADIAIDPTNENIWYVAVGSGGVWKTVNAGTTFEPIFDDQAVYSTGCVTIDPSNPHVIWVGTGENVGGRHVSFGDGIYKSENGGKTWTNMGLTASEHISKIIVHPDNSDVILVAVQGPLWNPGGERGFYKSIDGGKSWIKTLGDERWTGVTDLAMDPLDPNRLYAATWEHHRTVAAWMGGSEKSRIYMSKDGGDTWEMLTEGLPEGKMGKIGLAISPINPDVLYANIELNRRKGGIWRSANRGASWIKMSDMVSGATGPHYYQEIYASPHKFDRLYMMNNWLQISEDGGKTWRGANRDAKHGDNHVITFKQSDPNYLLVGTDGGVYESFDVGETWRYMENLPLTQFYKVAVDDAVPFYNIYGGTQDNSTEGGPSRTDNLHGIRNADWKVVLNWDGHQPATEPGNPNIIYAERQEGNLSRVDIRTGEVVDIQPQPGEGESNERFNWDAPILVSPHNPATIFFASQRVWKSENRGDSWTAISGDLTKNENRVALPIMGRIQSFDAPWDVYAMSNYNTITSLAQSPLNEAVIYAGTDDGLLQVTEDGGNSWKKINVSGMGVPSTSFINDVKTDLYDESTVYVSLDNHKYGDYRPYLVKSTDKGVTWTKMTNGLGKKNLVWRFVQDHVNKELMFLGTEFGIYFTVNAGKSWTALEGGVPTISFRDLAIQRRENDLVAASFGRGFFVLDDYSALRNIGSQMNKEAALFKPRDAWWYIPRSVLDFERKRGSQGNQLYVADNPDFGAVFTYFLGSAYKSDSAQRMEAEKDMTGNIPFPGWDKLDRELREVPPVVFLEIKQGNTVIRRVKAMNEKGLNRVAWDLKVANKNPLDLDAESNDDQLATGLMVAPGIYTATLYKMVKGEASVISGSVDVVVKPLYEGSLPGALLSEVASFWRSYETVSAEIMKFTMALNNLESAIDKLLISAQSSSVGTDVINAVGRLQMELDRVDLQFNGNKAKNEIGEKNPPTINERIFAVNRGVTRSTYGPTETHKQTMTIIQKELARLQNDLGSIRSKAEGLHSQITAAGGPSVEGL